MSTSPCEIGSFLEYPSRSSLAVERAGESDDLLALQLTNSGRGALQSILHVACDSNDEGTVWMPSYYCWDVTRYIADGRRVRTYPSTPTGVCYPSEFADGDVLVITSYFGQRPQTPSTEAASVLLDTTHDPLADWAKSFPAGWVFGSLRKTLPMSEGGYVADRLSDQQLVLKRARIKGDDEYQRGLAAIQAKAKWLIDGHGSKSEFYLALQQHEEAFAHLEPTQMSETASEFLRTLPVRHWRHQRIQNAAHLRATLGDAPAFQALPSTFGVPLLMRTPAEAEEVKRTLIENEIYPAVIWPQPDEMHSETMISKRLLLLHTDHRYGSAEMERTAQTVRLAIQ